MIWHQTIAQDVDGQPDAGDNQSHHESGVIPGREDHRRTAIALTQGMIPQPNDRRSCCSFAA